MVIGAEALDDALPAVGVDGDVVVIAESTDALEDVRRKTRAPNVFFLLGDGAVLPLPDASVDGVLGTATPDESARVLRGR